MTDEAATGRRVLRTWGVVAGLAVAAALAALVAWLVPRWNDTGMTGVEREVERLRAAGFATTPEEWDADLDPAAAARAAEIDAADAWLLERFGDPATWSIPGPWSLGRVGPWWNGLTDADRDALRTRLAEAARYFERIDGAARRGGIRWPMLLDAQGVVDAPHVARLQRLFMLHQARLRVAPDAGARLAIVAVLLRVGAGGRANQLVDEAVRNAMRSGAVAEMRDLVTAGEVSAAAAREACGSLLRDEHVPAIGRAARSEIVWTLSALRATASGRLPTPGARLPTGLTPVMQLLHGTPAGGLRALREVAEVDVVEPAAAVRETRRIEEEARRIPRIAVGMMPTLAERLTRTDAALRLARVALAAKERHETTGAWPPSLDALGEDFPDGIPVDPYTGRPFRYDVGDAVVRISSAAAFPGDPPADREVAATLTWTFQR